MRDKLLRLVLSGLTMVTLPCTLTAQTNVVAKSNANVRQVRTHATVGREQARRMQEYRQSHPLLFRQKRHIPRYSEFPTAGLPVMGNAPLRHSAAAPLKAANPNATIWVDMTSNVSWTNLGQTHYGYYTCHPSDPLYFLQLGNDQESPIGDHGVQLMDDGKLYGIHLNENYYYETGYYFVYLNEYDTQTWTGTTYDLGPDDLSLVAMETAQASDGTVYGQFFNTDGTSLELGTVDYSTRTRTTISTGGNTYVALGITREGQLYGIADNGNLYRINKTTGAETLVGPTGKTLLIPNENAFYTQTGEIDQSDDTFYWYCVDASGTAGLYTVDLQTGAATEVGNSTVEADITGMVIPAPATSAEAPSAVSDASFTPSSATSHSGTLTFTAPTTTYSGNNLSGTLNYNVTTDGQTLAEGTVSPGGRIDAPVTVPDDGLYTFIVTTSNGNGTSPKARVRSYIGYDTPEAPSAVSATANGKEVTISWTAPQQGIHQGALDALTYNVFRIANNDTTTIASGIDGTSYTDEVESDQLTSYVYAVQAISHGKESSIASTEPLVIGSSIEPDWVAVINNNDIFSQFTVIDANNDGKTWRFYNDEGVSYARSNFSFESGNDDWLVSPPIHLKAGTLYKVSFDIINGFPNPNYYNSLEVKLGNAPTAEAMTQTIMPTTEPDGNAWSTASYDLNVPADGDYYIGFHDNTASPDRGYINLQTVSIKKSADGSSPDKVNNLNITPAAEGALSAQLSFDVPTTTIDGSPLQSVDKIEISRDGSLIATLTAQQAGAHVTYSDNAVPTDGQHTYDVVATANGGQGRIASATAFIGHDIPATPDAVTLVDNNTDILAKWAQFPSVGSNGGYVEPSQVAVSIYDVMQTTYGVRVTDSLATSTPGGTSVNVPLDPSASYADDGESQSLLYLAARSENGYGHTGFVPTHSLVAGTPLTLPYKESLSGGTLDNGFAWVEGNDQQRNRDNAATWVTTRNAAQDDDGGSVIWTAYTRGSGAAAVDYDIQPGDQVSINTPKVSLKNATNPHLIFYVNPIVADEASLDVVIATPDGTEQTVGTYDLSTTTQSGWIMKDIDLSAFKSQRYVIVKFRATATGSNVSVGIDNINILDQAAVDLAAVGITTPGHIKAGKSGQVSVAVQNVGGQAVSSYDVVLYANNIAVDTVKSTASLGVMDIDTVSLTLPVRIDQSSALKVKATIIVNDDSKADNNSTETKTVKVIVPQYTTVNDLSGSESSDGTTVLSWSKPVAPESIEVNEGFEDYEQGATSFGDWTLVDNDHGLTGSLFAGLPTPGQGTSFAFEIINPDELSTDEYDVLSFNPGYTPHDGDQYAWAPYGWSADGQSVVNADNWLISPELPQKAQTIQFYAMNLAESNIFVYRETFDVLYSDSDDPTDFSSFKVITSNTAAGTKSMYTDANWTQYDVDIPASAKYFAIHQNTPADNNYVFGLDDIHFQRSTPGLHDNIIGYNIYRDGKLIGTVDGNALTFTDNTKAPGNHVYNITVRYQSQNGEVNESAFSNDATVISTGISAIHANQQGTYDIYLLDGSTVALGAKSLNGLKRGVYIINGKKCIVP